MQSTIQVESANNWLLGRFRSEIKNTGRILMESTKKSIYVRFDIYNTLWTDLDKIQFSRMEIEAASLQLRAQLRASGWGISTTCTPNNTYWICTGTIIDENTKEKQETEAEEDE